MLSGKLLGAVTALLVVCRTDGFLGLPGKNVGPDSQHQQQAKYRGNRRLAPGFLMEDGHLRVDPRYERANFDPAVAAHETDADLEYLGYEQDMFDEEENSEFWGGFNISERIIEVFPLVDTDGNGMLALEELHAWQYLNGHNASMRRSARQFNSSDIDGDGRITLHEYLSEHFHPYLLMDAPPSEATSDYDDLELDIRDWHYAHDASDKFRLANVNGDAGLDLAEYHEFLHPEESENRALHNHVVKREIKDSDKDSDGHVSEQEFADGLWHMFYSWGEIDDEYYEWSEEKEQQRAEAKFTTIDANADGFIDEVELMPLFHDMFPNESYYAKIQAQDVLSEADTDKDGQLTMAEMLENKNVFYSLIDDHRYPSYYDYHEYYHDEF